MLFVYTISQMTFTYPVERLTDGYRNVVGNTYRDVYHECVCQGRGGELYELRQFPAVSDRLLRK